MMRRGGSVAALLGAPGGAFIAQHVYGYIPNKGMKVTEMPADLRHNNVHALSLALLWMMVVPWLLSLCLYGLLYYLYPIDKARVQQEKAARAASEDSSSSSSSKAGGSSSGSSSAITSGSGSVSRRMEASAALLPLQLKSQKPIYGGYTST
eukprot:Filipodium_phascolosomae@DN7550_c0_g1_i1.p1